MSAQPKVIRRSVALFLNRKSIPQLIVDARHYVARMTGNPHFPNPNPGLTAVTNEIDALEAASLLARTKAVGTAGAMHVAAKTLRISLKALGGYVELQANQDPDNAEIMIESSGMIVKKLPQRQQRQFNIKLGPVAGSVKLDTKAVKRGAYIYQATSTPNDPNSWKEIYLGTKVRFEAEGLTSGLTWFFRTATIDKNGKGAWSFELSTIVH
ncbi:MAG: hypothetical protein ACHQRM_09125 [Bacteroidia bacterium]